MDNNLRSSDLKKITRFDDFTDIMFFRPNLYFHSRKVFFLVKAFHSLISPDIKFDFKKSQALALIHDDDELFTGDILAQYKINFTNEEKEKYEKEKSLAFEKLVLKYGDDFNGYSYSDLLEEIDEKSSFEALVVDLADKFDAHCEVCHEILSGNKEFEKPLTGFEGKTTNPYDFTWTRVISRIEKLKNAGILISQALDFKKSDDFYSIVEDYKIETSFDNLFTRTKYKPYLFWISSIKKFGNKDDFNELIVQKEK